MLYNSTNSLLKRLHCVSDLSFATTNTTYTIIHCKQPPRSGCQKCQSKASLFTRNGSGNVSGYHGKVLVYCKISISFLFPLSAPPRLSVSRKYLASSLQLYTQKKRCKNTYTTSPFQCGTKGVNWPLDCFFRLLSWKGFGLFLLRSVPRWSQARTRANRRQQTRTKKSTSYGCQDGHSWAIATNSSLYFVWS